MRRLLKVCSMQYKAVIFDMDGLLIDSEPLWSEAGKETLEQFGKILTEDQYNSSTGLRTEEWIEHWFSHFKIDRQHSPGAVQTIIQKAIDKIGLFGEPLPGVQEIIGFFRDRNFRVGLATSSPLSLANVVIKKLGLKNAFDSIASAGELPFGKPHPQVYLNCAAQLNSHPVNCIAFEDSFYGMIAAKAARMKCVVVPAEKDFDSPKWNAADLKLISLADFDEVKLKSL